MPSHKTVPNVNGVRPRPDRLLLAISIAVLFTVTALLWFGYGNMLDAGIYARAVANIGTDASIYDPIPPPGPNRFITGYIYPPFYVSLLYLLGDPIRANLIGMALGVAALAWGVARASGISLGRIAAFTLLSIYPLIAMAFGSVTPIVYGLCAAAFVVPANIGAFMLAIAAGIKVTPLWPLAILVVRERAWKGTAAAAVVGVGVCVIVLGFQGLLTELDIYIRHVVPMLAQGQFISNELTVGSIEGGPLLFWATARNISPTFAPLYWLVEDHTGALPTWASTYLTVTSTAIPLAVVWLTRKRSWREQAAWVLAAAVVCSPIFRTLYFPFLFPAVAFWWRNRAAPPASGTLNP
jgi:hypothetical protein